MAITKVTLTAVGDIMLADSPFLIGHGARSVLEKSEISVIAQRIRAFTEEGDINFANLECVLSDVGLKKHWLPSLEIRGNPLHVDFLKEAGWNVINIANNHIFQHGLECFHDSLIRVRKKGIKVIGDDTDSGSRFTKSETSPELGFVGFSLRPEQYRIGQKPPYAFRNSTEEILQEIRSIRKEFTGPLICSLHWGYEFMEEPSQGQQDFARALIDNGVSLILGHHPHVLQAVEEYNGGLIAYSLGNFIFDLIGDRTKYSMALIVDFTDQGIESYRIKPALIGDDHCPTEPLEDDRKAILLDMQTKAENLAQTGPLNDEILESQARVYYEKYRKSCYKYFLSNLHRYSPNMIMQSIGRAGLRRLKIVHNP